MINSDFIISSKATVKEVMLALDKLREVFETLFVVDNNKLIGTITEGDIRRYLIKGDISHNDVLTKILNIRPFYIKENEELDEKLIIQFKKSKKYKYVPCLNSKKEIVDIVDLNNLFKRKNFVILMAGGLGSRLKPLTNKIPKPMLKVGNKPILETIIEQFKSYGFYNFLISVNYKSNIIKDYFNRGESLDVSIDYIEENKRLGTAGALSLINNKLDEPIFVMNGDILTNINFKDLLTFHKNNNFELTVCVIKHAIEIPYGVLDASAENVLIDLVEKPTKEFLVNAGVYLLNPYLQNEIPKDTFHDMPTFLKELISQGRKVGVYEVEDYWMDIGHPEDFKKANDEYNYYFGGK